MFYSMLDGRLDFYSRGAKSDKMTSASTVSEKSDFQDFFKNNCI